jgi:hypothetical protein
MQPARPNRPLSLHIQKMLLDQIFPGAVCRVLRKRLTWDGFIQPSAVGHRYKIRLVYDLGLPLDVFLLEPDPRILADAVRPGRILPHNYGGTPLKLCLYLPGSGEWKSSQPLATTIVPWTSMWLAFFEDWLVTDVWSGGGIHPNVKEAEKPGSGANASPRD